MKRIFFTLVVLAILAITTPSFGQGFGLKGSFNFFNLVMKDFGGDKIENKMIPKLDAGVFYEALIAPGFYLRPELNFASKGANLAGSSDLKVNLNYLEVPFLLLYKGALSDGKVLLGFGPYLAIGINGKAKSDDTDIDIRFKSDINSSDYTNPVAYYTPFDFGGKFLAGYEFGSGLSFALNASYGMSNMYPKRNGVREDISTKNAGFGLTLGYRFGK
jgi:hypothetical protein